MLKDYILAQKSVLYHTKKNKKNLILLIFSIVMKM